MVGKQLLEWIKEHLILVSIVTILSIGGILAFSGLFSADGSSQKNCSERGGRICPSGQICKGDTVKTPGTTQCCLEGCKKKAKGDITVSGLINVSDTWNDPNENKVECFPSQQIFFNVSSTFSKTLNTDPSFPVKCELYVGSKRYTEYNELSGNNESACELYNGMAREETGKLSYGSKLFPGYNTLSVQYKDFANLNGKTIRLIIDPENEIPETKENNNEFKYTFGDDEITYDCSWGCKSEEEYEWCESSQKCNGISHVFSDGICCKGNCE